MKIDEKKNKIQERAFKIVYRDTTSQFKELGKDNADIYSSERPTVAED